MVLTKAIHVGWSGHGFLAWIVQPDSIYSVWPLIALYSLVLSLFYLHNLLIPS